MALTSTRRVTRGEPCPVCGRPTWCLVACDGRYVVCMRTESERPAQGSQGGWIHRQGSGTCHAPGRPAASAAGNRPAATAPQRHVAYAYQALLNSCGLRREHTADLLRRGFTEEEIRQRGYATLRLMGRRDICARINRDWPGVLDGVPGFYQKGNGYGLAGCPGLLIPARGPGGSIRGIRIRPDDAGDGGKYRWLSSDGRPGGVGSGAHCHVSRPLGPARDAAVWITEGELKADYSTQRLGAIVVSIPGVGVWARALPDIQALLPTPGRVVVALDSDFRTKPQVACAIWNLILAAQALGHEVEVALWDESAKGLDDLLKAGGLPERSPPTVISPPEWKLKRSSIPLADGLAPQDRAITLEAARNGLVDRLSSLLPSRQCA